MSDYARANTGGATHFGDKDALTTGDPNKVIVGAQYDSEFNAILTACNSKYDSDDLASQAEAEAETATGVLIRPLNLAHWADYNAGMVGDIRDMTDPGADTLLGWDDSASSAIGFTLGAALEFGDGTFNMKDAVAGGGLTISSSIMAVGGGNGITVNANDIDITDVAVTATNPVGFTSGAPVFDMSSLTAMEGSALAATDVILVEDGGAPKQIAIQDMGMRVQNGQTTQTVAAADMNSIMEFTGTATLTLPLNATVDLPLGVPIVLNMKHATQELTVTAAASVTLVSVYHPAGTAAASDVVEAGGTALLYKTAADVWCLSGDIADA